MAKANMSLTRNGMPTQDAKVRAHNFDEVALGYTEEQAIDEAMRCLNCKNMPCVAGCPVKIHIPEFINKIKEMPESELAQFPLGNLLLEIDWDQVVTLASFSRM